MTTVSKRFETGVMKAATENGELFVEGAVLIPEVEDRQGDVISADEIRKASYDYMVRSQRAGEMHETMISRSDAALVESRITKRAEKINGASIPAGSWIVKFKIVSAKLQKAINAGHFRGFSIGGRGMRDEE